MFITEVKVKGHFALDYIILFCPAFCDITGIVKVDFMAEQLYWMIY